MKEIEIFKIVPDNFFSVLSSPNKTIYMRIISLIYSLVQNGLSYGIDKEILVDEIEDYLNATNFYVVDEEEEIKNNRDKANFFIRRLIDTGWIHSDNTADYRLIINFHDYAIKILESFIKIANKESLEYQGNIISIYTLLYSNEKSGVVIKQVYENTKGLISGLKNLNSNIVIYINRLTKQKTPEEIVEELFGNYTKDIIDKSYHRLKTSENISKYRPKIINKLKENLENNLFIEEAATFYREAEEIESSEEAIARVKEIINSIIDAFEELDDIIDDIDKKNAKYIKAAVTRAKFLLNNTKDMTGLIKGILYYVSERYKELDLKLSSDYLEEITDLFTLYSYNYIDETSLYTANEGKKSFRPNKIEKVSLSKEDRAKKIAEFKKKQEKQFSIKKVNKIVLDILKDRDSFNTKEIKINSIDDFIKIIYIRLYGNNPLSKYKIKKLNDTYSENDFKFNNFEVWRKK